MSETFSKIAILGPGLLGGSIGLACREVGYEVAFWGRSEERLIPVQATGFSASTDLKAVIKGAGLVIMAIPVPHMAGMAEQLVRAGLDSSQIVTDVGSVKHAVVEAVQPILGMKGFHFIGSHPMAGSEQQGFAAAKAEMLKNATCIITVDKHSQKEDFERLSLFWKSLGMCVSQLTPVEHDEMISRVSHVPHILASVCAHVALPKEEYGVFSGGGLRDTSRIASGDAELWSGIISENAEEISAHLDEAIERMKAYQQAIKSEDPNQLKKLLQEDKNRRDSYFSK